MRAAPGPQQSEIAAPKSKIQNRHAHEELIYMRVPFIIHDSSFITHPSPLQDP